jgi:hypothetical protein
MTPGMRLGIDFDNTIVCYDGLFHRVALEQGLIDVEVPATKQAVRDALRRADREAAWTELQGLVYGARIVEAEAFAGVTGFFRRCRALGVPVFIISHKTRRPYAGPDHDLHRAAGSWLEARGFHDPGDVGLPRAAVHFELTKADKLARIAQEGCTHFIDDLPEFLAESAMPAGVTPILFDPAGAHAAAPYARAASWAELETMLLGGVRP